MDWHLKNIKNSTIVLNIKNFSTRKLFFIFYTLIVSSLILIINLYNIGVLCFIIPYKHGAGIVLPLAITTQAIISIIGLIGGSLLIKKEQRGYYAVLIWALVQTFLYGLDYGIENEHFLSWLNLQLFFGGESHTPTSQLLFYNGITSPQKTGTMFNVVGLFLVILTILVWSEDSDFIRNKLQYISLKLKKIISLGIKLSQNALIAGLILAIIIPYINKEVLNKSEIEFDIINAIIDCEVEYTIEDIKFSAYIVNFEIDIKNGNADTSINNIYLRFRNLGHPSLPELNHWIIFPLGFREGQLLGFYNGKFIGTILQGYLYDKIPKDKFNHKFTPVFIKRNEIKKVAIPFIFSKYFLLEQINLLNADIGYNTVNNVRSFNKSRPFIINIRDDIVKH